MSAPNTQQTINTVQLNVPADGLVIGGASTALVSFWGATPVAQQAGYGVITDSSGGTGAATNGILTLTGTYNSAIIGNAIATLAAGYNSIRTMLNTIGLSSN